MNSPGLISSTVRVTGKLCRNGKRDSLEEGRIRGRWTDIQTRETDNSHKELFRRNLVDRCLCV